MFKKLNMKKLLMMIMKKLNNYIIFYIFLGVLFASYNQNIEVIKTGFNQTEIYYFSSNSNYVDCNISENDILLQTLRMDKSYTRGESGWWVCTFFGDYQDTYSIDFIDGCFSYIENAENTTIEFNDIKDIIKDDILSKNYQSAITQLKTFIKHSSNNNEIAFAEYLIAEVYLNDFKNYEYSVELLKNIINNYKGTEIYKKSLFTLSYIYANHLNYFTDAIYYYENFLKLFPNDDLIPSVKYELASLYEVKF